MTAVYLWLGAMVLFGILEAVTAARRASLGDCGGNTWAAYQCYGDPQWRWHMREDPDAASRETPDQRREEIA